MSQLLDINTWDRVCPVLLPVGAATMSTVFIASMGILVPFSIFVVVFFVYLHGLWVSNSADDAEELGKAATVAKSVRYGEPSEDVFLAISASRQAETNQKRFGSSIRPGSIRGVSF